MGVVSEAVWDEIVGHVRTRHAPLARGWFSQLVPSSLEHGVLDVQTNTMAQHDYLCQHCAGAFSEAAQRATGRLVSVRFVAPKLPPEATAPLSFVDGLEKPALNKDYVFDNFVVGPCNRLAHAASVAVGDAPGRAYNPLFLHGNVGLGKTHLLQAACHKILQDEGSARVVFLSCETFTNHFIEAIERGALHEFRYRYRHADVLAIDDVQFLAARDRSQEEFFHTFNTLYQAQKQIILTADTPPKEIAGIEDRLISRFNWGLVARLDPPCLETRIAIVQKKARIRCIELPEDVIHYIASNIDSNTRELEGAIIKVDALAQQYDGRSTVEIAKRALGDDTTIQRTEISIPRILEAVVARYNVKLADLQSKKRSKSIAFARQVCMYLARELTGLSLEEIGRWFGGRDHTTVLHATRLVRKLRGGDRELDQTLSRLADELRRP